MKKALPVCIKWQAMEEAPLSPWRKRHGLSAHPSFMEKAPLSLELCLCLQWMGCPDICRLTALSTAFSQVAAVAQMHCRQCPARRWCGVCGFGFAPGLDQGK